MAYLTSAPRTSDCPPPARLPALRVCLQVLDLGTPSSLRPLRKLPFFKAFSGPLAAGVLPSLGS